MTTLRTQLRSVTTCALRALLPVALALAASLGSTVPPVLAAGTMDIHDHNNPSGLYHEFTGALGQVAGDEQFDVVVTGGGANMYGTLCLTRNGTPICATDWMGQADATGAASRSAVCNTNFTDRTPYIEWRVAPGGVGPPDDITSAPTVVHICDIVAPVMAITTSSYGSFSGTLTDTNGTGFDFGTMWAYSNFNGSFVDTTTGLYYDFISTTYSRATNTTPAVSTSAAVGTSVTWNATSPPPAAAHICGHSYTWSLHTNDYFRDTNTVTHSFTATLGDGCTPQTYTITPSAGPNGSISPSTPATVTQGANSPTYRFYANDGFMVDTIVIDGTPTGSDDLIRAFINVQANHTIQVTFKPVVTRVPACITDGIGDLNWDNFIDNYDQQILQNHLVGNVPQGTAPFTAPLTNADTEDSMTPGSITLDDNIILVNFLAGSVDCLPSGSCQSRSTNCSASPTTGTAPIAVDFTSAPTNAGNLCYTYDWDFDDGSAHATTQNVLGPGHTYGSNGTYDALLTLHLGSQVLTCSRTITLTPPPSFTVTATSGANGAILPGGPSVVLQGANSPNFNVFPAPGYMIDQLLIDGVAGSIYTNYQFTNVQANHTIHVTWKPVPTTIPSCTTNGVGDLNQSGSIDGFDIQILESHIVGNTPQGTAPFTAPLAMADTMDGAGEAGVININDDVILNAFLVGTSSCMPSPSCQSRTVACTATPTSGTTPQLVDFTSTPSTGTVGYCYTFDWDFDDGSAHGATQDVTGHNYASNGSYNPRITASLGAQDLVCTKSVVLTPPGCVTPPTLSISGVPANIGQGQTFTFSVQKSAAASWTLGSALGNGLSPSSGPGDGPVTITYTATNAGSETITLTSVGHTDASCSDISTTATLTVNANTSPVCSAISATPNPQIVGTPVAFSTTSSDPDGDALTYAWDFGDSSTDTGATPSHAYGAAGVYTVQATVKDPTHPAVFCPNTSVTINPLACPVIDSFTATPATIFTSTASLLAWTTTDATSVSINQGLGAQAVDGSVSTGPLLADRTYTLTASKAGCANVTQAVTVTVTAVDDPPVCGVSTATPNPGDAPLTATLEHNGATDDLGITQYNWTYVRTAPGAPVVVGSGFGQTDTFTFPTAGTYEARMRLQDGSQSTVCMPAIVTVTPLVCPSLGHFTATPATVLTNGTSLLDWAVSNATTVSIDQGIGAVPATSSQSTGALAATTTYTLTATKAGCADVTATATVLVTAVPNLIPVGSACVDTQPPAYPASGASLSMSGGIVRTGITYIRAGTNVVFTLRTVEDATCGLTRFHLRLTGDSTFDLTTDGVGAPTITTPSSALSYVSQTAPVTTLGVTSITVTLAGAGAATTAFDTIAGDVVDAAGNTLPLSTFQRLTVDTVAPTCSFTDPLSGAVVGAFPLNLTFTADDGEAKGSGIRNPVDPTQTVINLTYSTNPGAILVGTASEVWSDAPDAGIGPGTGSSTHVFSSTASAFNHIDAQVADIAGNVCSTTLDIAVDATAPRFVRALPVSRGFIASDVDTLTLEFYEEDLSVTGTDNVTLCNPTVPPDAGSYRIALFDITETSYASFPLDTLDLVPSCTGAFPNPPLRGDGVTIPTITTSPVGTAGDYFYTFLKLSGSAPVAGHAPNVLTRGHTYQLRIRNITDVAGNTAPISIVNFSYFLSPDPLRVTERVDGALTTPYAASGTTRGGTGVEVARSTLPGVDERHNCVDLFVGGPVANTSDAELLQSPFLVRHTLSLIADSSDTLQATIEAPFDLTAQLPPYFHAVDVDCADGGAQTQVRYEVLDAGGASVATGTVALAPTTADAATSNRSYGSNMDYPVADTTYHKGEKGRKLTFPFSAATLPGGIPVGGRLDVTYFTYVSGYAQ